MSTVRVLAPPPVSFELLEEPPLVFGGLSLARDPKAGLALAGPAGIDTALHPAEIDIALIGTGATIEVAQRWIENCANVIAGNAKKPRQVPDFPGFSPISPFKSSMRPQQAIQGLITDMDVRGITGEARYEDGFKKAVDLLTEKVTLTCESLP